MRVKAKRCGGTDRGSERTGKRMKGEVDFAAARDLSRRDGDGEGERLLLSASASRALMARLRNQFPCSQQRRARKSLLQVVSQVAKPMRARAPAKVGRAEISRGCIGFISDNGTAMAPGGLCRNDWVTKTGITRNNQRSTVPRALSSFSPLLLRSSRQFIVNWYIELKRRLF